MRALGRLIVGVLVVAAARFATDVAVAEHPKDPHDHIGSMNDPNEGETGCVRVYGDATSWEDARSRLTLALYSQANAARDWQGGLANLDFYISSFQCPDFTPAPGGGDSNVELYFYVANDVDAMCAAPAGAGTPGCAYLLGEILYPVHKEKRYAVMAMRADQFLLDTTGLRHAWAGDHQPRGGACIGIGGWGADGAAKFRPNLGRLHREPHA